MWFSCISSLPNTLSYCSALRTAMRTFERLARERREQRVDFRRFVPRTHILERLRCLAPGESGLIRISERPRSLAELAQQLGLEQPVFETFSFEYRDSQSSNACVVGSPFALDSRSAFECAGDGEVVAAAARAF